MRRKLGYASMFIDEDKGELIIENPKYSMIIKPNKLLEITHDDGKVKMVDKTVKIIDKTNAK